MNPFDPNDKLSVLINKHPLFVIVMILFLAMMMDSL